MHAPVHDGTRRSSRTVRSLALHRVLSLTPRVLVLLPTPLDAYRYAAYSGAPAVADGSVPLDRRPRVEIATPAACLTC